MVDEHVVGEFIEALRINIHAIVIMDRDAAGGEELKPWVQRIKQELDRHGGLHWVTAGLEVENYVPIDVLRKIEREGAFKIMREPGRYDRFFECVNFRSAHPPLIISELPPPGPEEGC